MKISTSILAMTGLLALAGTANAAPLYNWTGGYVGLQGSYNWSHSQATYDYGPLQTNYPLAAMNGTGGGFGIEGGANYLLPNGFLIGIEGAVSYGSLSATIPDDYGTANHSGGPHFVTSTTDWSGDLRARLGFAFEQLLVFGTVGVASAHATVHATDGNLSDSATLSGVTFGGGLEKALTDKVSLKLEYLHTALDSHTWFNGQLYSSTGSSTSDAVRVGINLHF